MDEKYQNKLQTKKRSNEGNGFPGTLQQLFFWLSNRDEGLINNK